VRDTGYFVAPPSGPGPGVLLLHSWWGLTPFFRKLADRLADEGFSVLAPDLNFGSVFADRAEAEAHLGDASPDRLARITLNSAKLLQSRSVDPGRPVAAVGFSMGASLALWASVRLPNTIGAVVAFYGSQAIDFAGSRAAYQLHLADHDDLVTDDDAAFLEATIGLEGLAVEVHRYPGTTHWFFEEDRSGHYQPEAARLAWERMLAFLAREPAPS
jgi:carboxymethylenebutenolidase